MKALLFFILLTTPAMAENLLEVTTPTDATSNLRNYKEMAVGKIKRKVLVVERTVPASSKVRIDLDSPLLYQWIQLDRNTIVQSSMPYYEVKILEIPREANINDEEREALLNGSFKMHIYDLNTPLVVAQTFQSNLPKGVEKTSHMLPWEEYNPKGTWAYSIQQAINQDKNSFLLSRAPRDIADFCPRFDSLTKIEKEYFWLSLMAHISYFESRYIPFTASDEGRYDNNKKGVISSGLTQISLASSRASCYQTRGCSVLQNQNDLFDPEKNLTCAIGIMSCLSESAGCVSCKRKGRWQGIAKYWSTMQEPRTLKCSTCPGGKIIIGKKPEIKAALKTTAPFCF